MNRPGAVPQTLRGGMPGNFGGQQQPQQQQNRAVSSRLPNGKLASGNSNSGWAFSGAVPMGNSSSGGFQTQNRQLGGSVSFAQSLGGSQQAAPIDLSEFPSLSNNPQLGNPSQASMWSTGGSRNVSAPVQRNQPTPVLSQHAGQDELYASTSRAMANGSLRFGNQTGQQAAPGSVDDFPPLNRTVNGEERSASLMSSLGISAQTTASQAVAGNRGNGLLNALSANNRANEPRSQSLATGAAATPQPSDYESQSRSSERLAKQFANLSTGEGSSKLSSQDGVINKAKEDGSQGVVDPLAGMSEVDKWGLKGLRTLMNNYADYHALRVGMDTTNMGLDLQSAELISTQKYSLFDDTPPKPTLPTGKLRLPECYKVNNVQPIKDKIASFSEDTLLFIFYSCPADKKQLLAAQELHTRNWRWHKKLQIWLTKDKQLPPQQLGPSHERGWYVVWDVNRWVRERREITLYYDDLETVVNPLAGTPAMN